MNSNSIKVGVLVAALAGAGFLFFRNLSGPSESGRDMSQPTYWVCRNEACGKDFEVSLAELARKKDDMGRIACTFCGQMKTTRANPCPNCSRNLEFVGHGELPAICPYCKSNVGDVAAHGQKPAAAKSKGKAKSGG